MNAMTDNFEFKPAVRENAHVLIGLAGASGSGKTKTALILAEGLSPSGKIGMIDTEADRGLHYATDHKFMHTGMRPPFHPERIVTAVQAAERAGLEVLIIDSMSHEYDGEGGILDWANELAEGTPKPGIAQPRTSSKEGSDWWKDWIKKPVTSPGNWKEPKLAHKQMMNKLLQARIHLIFCLRADEKIKIVPPSKENDFKTQIVPLGWVPICEKRFMFEMTLSFTLRPDEPGRPQYDLPHKINEQHKPFFPAGKLISRDAGRLLGEWARGGAPQAVKPLSAPDFDPAVFADEVRAKCDASTNADDLKAWANSTDVMAKRSAVKKADENLATEIRTMIADRIGVLAAGGDV